MSKEINQNNAVMQRAAQKAAEIISYEKLVTDITDLLYGFAVSEAEQGMTDAEAERFAAMPDAEVLKIADLKLPVAQRDQLADLLERNREETLSEAEQITLAQLVEEYEEQNVEKSKGVKWAVKRGLKKPEREAWVEKANDPVKEMERQFYLKILALEDERDLMAEAIRDLLYGQSPCADWHSDNGEINNQRWNRKLDALKAAIKGYCEENKEE